MSIPDKAATFRPTRSRIRESIISILLPYLNNAITADLCAGSGAVGFEMISRGAQHVTFVEPDQLRCQQLRSHVKQFGIQTQCTIRTCTIESFLSSEKHQFDILFYDPPYDLPEFQHYIPGLLYRLSNNGILIYERRTTKEKLQQNSAFSAYTINNRIYGETEICIFRKQ